MKPRGRCPVCKRADVLLRKDGTIRAHYHLMSLGRPFGGLAFHCRGAGQAPSTESAGEAMAAVLEPFVQALRDAKEILR